LISRQIDNGDDIEKEFSNALSAHTKLRIE